jgi:8-oxo-dGTP diphosphatase
LYKKEKNIMTEVKFYDALYEPDGTLNYAVITARYENKWIFVRHQDLSTWEIAGGHIESGETSHEAARRELMEETGAVRFNLECVATYSVTREGEAGYGRLYLAEVAKLGDITDVSEIAEIVLLDTLPENLTYPDIQPFLFRRAIDYQQVGNPDPIC